MSLFSAQITHLNKLKDKPKDLTGKLVVAAVDLSKKQVGPLMWECPVTGSHNEHGEVVLRVPEKPIPSGTKLMWQSKSFLQYHWHCENTLECERFDPTGILTISGSSNGAREVMRWPTEDEEEASSLSGPGG
jgi:hypothetical protein